MKFAPAQRHAVEEAARHKVLAINGRPRRRKDHHRQIDSGRIRQGEACRLAAPTGRAAKRMSEATKRQATTLHRLLEFDPKGRAFSRNAKRRLDADVLIVDEASMINF